MLTRSTDKRRDGNPYEAVVIKDELDRDTALILKELTPNLPGVELRVEARRSYPSGDLTSHIVGYVGSISEEEYASLRPRGYILSDQVGKTGIEADYEDVLRGKPGEELAEVDASGRQLDVLDARAAQPGQSVFLTIDLELQRKATEALREYMGSSDNATAVVMDVHSGEILAMVSLPGYDNNLFSRAISQQELDDLLSQPGKPLVNHAVAEMYAPGSTFKTITGLAALQEGVATTGTVITSKGYITVENEYDPNVVYYFRDWAALGPLDFYRGVAMSSDVYFYYLAGGKADEGFRGLGEERLARYARAFGLGELTGVDLPGESPGIVPDARWKEQNWGETWYVGDTYSFGIGQGYLAVTPLQLVNAIASHRQRRRAAAAASGQGDPGRPRERDRHLRAGGAAPGAGEPRLPGGHAGGHAPVGGFRRGQQRQGGGAVDRRKDRNGGVRGAARRRYVRYPRLVRGLRAVRGPGDRGGGVRAARRRLPERRARGRPHLRLLLPPALCHPAGG